MIKKATEPGERARIKLKDQRRGSIVYQSVIGDLPKKVSRV
jgi:hypothetical protein